MIKLIKKIFGPKPDPIGDLYKEAHSHLNYSGYMLSDSKSGYKMQNPENFILFNANIFVINGSEYAKIWFGDIDVTKSHKQLRDLSESLNRTVYVLREMDGRFDYEKSPLIHKFAFCVQPNGKETLGDNDSIYYDSVSLKHK